LMAIAVCGIVTPILRKVGEGQAAACHVTAG